MITLITGAPGAGKTNALVSLLAELAEGRALYVSGIPDLQVPHVVLDDPTKWHEVVEDGAAVVIDEVQRVWRPNRSKIPDDIAALETHRHRGIDFFIVTQGPNLVHQNVRALVGRHVHLRDTGLTGRWWYEWPECAESVTTAWKQAPIKKLYRLDKKAQGLYTSASKHIKPIRSLPRSVLLLGAITIGIGVMGWRVYDQMKHKLDMAAQLGQPKTATSVAHAASQPGPELGLPPAVGAASAAAAASTPASAPQLAGCIAMRKRCECLDSAGFVMTLPLERCELNARRTGADLAYSYGTKDKALRDYLERVPDTAKPEGHAVQTAQLSPRAR